MVFSKVLENFDLTELLTMRKVQKRLAYEVVPKHFPDVRYDLSDCPEDDQDYTFAPLIKHAKKVEIRNICGTEDHLHRLEEIGKNQIGRIEFLYLEFDDDESTQDSDELARQYMEVFRKYFGAISRLQIDTVGDRNFTSMLRIMMEDQTFPWFENVTTLDIYQIRYLKDE